MKKTPDHYWASFFGLIITEYLTPGLQVVPHSGLHDYQGAWLFRRGSSTIISVASEMVADMEGKVSGITVAPAPISDQEFTALFGKKVTRVIGPTYHGVLEESDFRPLASSARLLSSADDESLHRLCAACDKQEWEYSDIHLGQYSHPQFGFFVNGDLVAVCNYRMESEGVAAPGIITHPQYRGRGYGKVVLSSATEHGLSQGFLMLYQTLLLNHPAVAVAQSLGYRHYATHLAVRLG